MSHEHSVCNVDTGILASTGSTVLIGGLINLKICGGGAVNLLVSFEYVKGQSRATFIDTLSPEQRYPSPEQHSTIPQSRATFNDTLRHVLLSLSPFLPGLLEEENPRTVWCIYV